MNLREKIEELAYGLGVCDVGFCKVDDFKEGFENGVSLVAKLSDEVLREISDRPTHSYFHHYRTVNTFLDQCLLQIGLLLERNGYRYIPIGASQSINLDGNPYAGRYSHKKAACLAGLGSIGKNVLFLHRIHGRRYALELCSPTAIWAVPACFRKIPAAAVISVLPCALQWRSLMSGNMPLGSFQNWILRRVATI